VTRSDVTLRLVDPATISDADVTAFATFANALRRERDLGEPPRSEASFRSNFDGMSALDEITLRWWFAEIGGTLAGHAFGYFEEGDDNRHLFVVTLEVDAARRRRGAGSALLERAAQFADEHGRTLLQSMTSDRIPAGDRFAQRFGATVGIRNRSSQLELAEADRAQLASWVAQGEAQQDRFDLGFWIGPYPDDDLEAIADLHGVMNTQPRDDLDAEDAVTTPKRLREFEAYMASRGSERWTAYVRERSNGTLAGYTEVWWEPHNPENLGQGDTGVLVAYRGLGLGKWLKAAMIERVLAERPEAKRIRTGNAASNDAMLGINLALGFRPYEATSVWQLPVATVRERLGGSGR
jgi:GNAT superfamily N-acetyltransferase